MIKKITIILACFTMCTLQMMAQKQAEIESVFDKYGKERGVVYVQLSQDILSQGSNLTLYKSMMIQYARKSQEHAIMTELYANKKSWNVLSEIRKSGAVESGTYHLGKGSTKKSNTYLLVKNKNGRMTILYIEGNFAPKQLEQELKKLKDLFIYVNDKKVQLY